jgi:hypothetical protein
MVTVAEAVRVLSAVDIAFTVTGFDAGTEFGAVYTPAVVIVPTVAFPPVTPLTCHVTPVLVEKFTVAANCCVCAALTETVSGLTTIGKARVTVASAVLLRSAWEVAVTTTVEELEITEGAV